jgi:hypothetical protein
MVVVAGTWVNQKPNSLYVGCEMRDRGGAAP